MATTTQKKDSLVVSGAPVSVFGGDTTPWTVYSATLEFTGKVVGGAPSDPKLVEGWLQKNLGITDKEGLAAWMRTHLAETKGIDPTQATDAEIEAALAENAAEKKAQVFKRTTDGFPYIEGRHVKAMLKEATSISWPRGEHKFGTYRNSKGTTVGGKDPKAYVAERVFVPEQPIIVGVDISGVELAVGHIPDWKSESGSRSTIGYFEYVENSIISFEVRVLDDCLEHEQWARIWAVAEMNGLGARRSQGAGQFVITAWDKI